MNIRRFFAAVLAAAAVAFSPVMPRPLDINASAAENSSGISYILNYKPNCTTIELTPSKAGNVLRYTSNGTKPTTDSTIYTGRLKIVKARTLKVGEFSKKGKLVGSILTIRVNLKCAPVSISMRRTKLGNYLVSMTTETEGADIYYTTNGSTPNTATSKTKKYTKEFKVAGGKTINAFAMKKGYKNSLGTTVVSGEETSADDPAVSDKYDPIIGEILHAVNKEREEKSLYALALDDTLCAAAQKRAEEIAADYSIEHNRPNGDMWFTVLREYSYKFSFAAENIGYCGSAKYNGDGDTAAMRIMQLWMDSPTHKGNILGKGASHIGIGFVSAGNYYYFVQIFGKR